MILHPTDFSSCSRAAETQAVRLARALGMDLLLGDEGPKIRYLVRSGVPAQEIVAVAAEEGAEMIVVTVRAAPAPTCQPDRA